MTPQPPQDRAHEILQLWRQERPDLEMSGKQVSSRLLMVTDALQARYSAEYRRIGLPRGSFGVLAALRRSGPPYMLTPKDLLNQLMFSSGGMSLLVDRLTQEGLVRRQPNPSDKRSQLIALTEPGRALIDNAVNAQADVDRVITQTLTPGEQRTLTGLLSKLLGVLEQG